MSDLPRDRQGRTAYDIIRESATLPGTKPGAKARGLYPPRDPRAPLLGPTEDMAVAKAFLERFPDMTPKEADYLAVIANDALSAHASLKTDAETNPPLPMQEGERE